MKPILRSRDYSEAGIYEQEQQYLFKPSWLFVGYLTELIGDNAWLKFELFGKSYFIQKSESGIHCFANTCPHRYSQLRTESCGDSSIVCPYHGWMFNGNGSLKAIPRKPRFCDVSEEYMGELSLVSFPVETWGILIFVQLDPEGGVPWHDFIHPIRSHLDSLINSIGTFKRRLQKKVKANWKVLIENSVEAYHINCVHPETFAKLELGTPNFKELPPHCIGSTPIGKDVLKRWKRVDHLLSSRNHHSDSYEHAIVFPNLGIGSLYGATIAVEQYLPLSSTETLYTMDLFGCSYSFQSNELEAAIMTLFENSFKAASKIFEEDMRISEIQQAGIMSAQHPGRLSEDELLILFLQKQWRPTGFYEDI